MEYLTNCTNNNEINEEEEEIPPTHFNTMDIKFLEVNKDKLTVRYVGDGAHAHDVGVSI
jgi:hypothetical protein